MPSDTVTVTIPGKPVAKGRPRMGRGGRVYTPETTTTAEKSLAWAFREACPVPLEGPLDLEVVFTFRYPKSWSKKKREEADHGVYPWYAGRPDLDNLLKLLTDAGNGVLWKDDAQVVVVDATKEYGAEDSTWIAVRVLEAR